MSQFQLQGIVPPLVTPLNADETIDEAALERQLARLLDAGIHAVFFLGSTGEQPALRESEREKATRVARRVIGSRVPLIVGTMASSTAHAIDNIRAAEKAGADAVAVTPPHYYPSRGEAEQVAHYRACAAATGLPVIIYNIPLTTKVQMAPETMARIAEIENVVGLKDSSGDFAHFLKILSLLRQQENFGCMVGFPSLAGPALLYGASGAVPGIANLCPRTMLDLYADAMARNIPALVQAQERVHKLLSILSHGAPVACFKAALNLMGICQPYTTAPIQPLGEDKRQLIAATLRELELL